MNKRVLYTMLIGVGLLLLYTQFKQKPALATEAPPAVKITPAVAPTDGKPADAKPTDAKATDAKADPKAPVVAPKPPNPEEPKPAEIVDPIAQPQLYDAKLTTYGGVLTAWTLLDPQFQEPTPDDKRKSQPINLVRRPLPADVMFPACATCTPMFEAPAGAAWSRTQVGDELVYTWENDRARVEKRYQAVPGTYQLRLRYTLENKTDEPANYWQKAVVRGYHDPHIGAPGMFSPPVMMTSGVCDVNGKLKNGDFASLLKATDEKAKGIAGVEERGGVRWVGIDEKYFVIAVALGVAPEGEERVCNLSATADGIITVGALGTARVVPPHAKGEGEVAIYLGPKQLHQLDRVEVAGKGAKLASAIDFGFTEIIARPMLAVLKAIHYVVPNWGVAIIILTILIKLVTFYPSQKSMKSMREMAKLKPELDKLKAKHGDDRNGFAQAQMKLFKERNVSPFGGCLPMALQFPIYIALYSMLRNSVELYRSPFIPGWIGDLTASDPYFITPLVTGAFMFLQQRLTPTPPDPQQKMLMYLMPVMFTAFTVFLPSGLTIYILTNTLLTMAQQYLVNRGDTNSKTLAKA